MGRPKKVIVENVLESVPESVVDVPKKKLIYSLTAKFKIVNSEGEKEILTFTSEDNTIEKLLGNLDFPAGTNCLVNVKFSRNGAVIEKALAPHAARLILHDKDVVRFLKTFRWDE